MITFLILSVAAILLYLTRIAYINAIKEYPNDREYYYYLRGRYIVYATVVTLLAITFTIQFNFLIP